jgi:DNA repair photolyase
MIPGLNDAELEHILEATSRAGAVSAGTVLLRLPHELTDLFINWLKIHMPERASHVLSLIRQMRGGKLYDAKFHTRFKDTGPYAELITKRFTHAAKQYGLSNERFALDTTKFAVPNARKEVTQLSLF